jgi:hypothetical protein
MGKGSTARPIPDRKTFEANFDAIFGKKDKKPEEKQNCGCNGMPRIGAMCGYVIVGGQLCGAPSEYECKFKGTK